MYRQRIQIKVLAQDVHNFNEKNLILYKIKIRIITRSIKLSTEDYTKNLKCLFSIILTHYRIFWLMNGKNENKFRKVKSRIIKQTLNRETNE